MASHKRLLLSQVKAPARKFRAVGVDLEDAALYFIGDFDDLQAAERAASARAGTAHPVYVFNDEGKLRVRCGSWA